MEKFQVGVNKFRSDCIELASQIRKSDFHFKNIYGIPRGGVLVALELAHHLDLPLTEKPDDFTLIVDDLIDSGETLREVVIEHTTPNWDALKPKTEVIYNCAVLYSKPHSPKVKFVHEHLKENAWIEFFYENTETDIQSNITRILEFIGENPNREGLIDTPKRVVKMYEEIFGGYKMNEEVLYKATFESDIDEMVLIKDIPFFSYCEHHMVPIFGKVHIAYIPKGKVLGLSKFSRLVDIYARRLQIQEQLTCQIAESIEKHLSPLGIGVIIEARHLCTEMRGIKKHNNTTVTSVTKGVFRDKKETREEFLNLIKL
jgi:GTP cyclohydrolase I